MFRERSNFFFFRTVFSLCLKMSPMRRLVYILTEILKFFSKPVIEYRELLDFTKNLQSDDLFSSGNITHSPFKLTIFFVGYIEQKKEKTGQ